MLQTLSNAQRRVGQNKAQGGFTLIELLVVVAIIAILAAIAIPQFNKYRANAMLSNVQNFTKSIANMSAALATTAAQHPNCSSATEFTLEWDATNGYIQAKAGDTICDKVKVYDQVPTWLDSISFANDAKLKIEGTQATLTGTQPVVQVKSNYTVGGKTLGCGYDSSQGKLVDIDTNTICHLE